MLVMFLKHFKLMVKIYFHLLLISNLIMNFFLNMKKQILDVI